MFSNFILFRLIESSADNRLVIYTSVLSFLWTARLTLIHFPSPSIHHISPQVSSNECSVLHESCISNILWPEITVLLFPFPLTGNSIFFIAIAEVRTEREMAELLDAKEEEWGRPQTYSYIKAIKSKSSPEDSMVN